MASISIREIPATLKELGMYCVVTDTGNPDKNPILLLHEALGSVDIWKNFPSELAKITGRSVIAYDRKGHGRSVSLTGKRSFNYLSEYTDAIPDLLAVVGREVNVKQPVYFGHSDGATISLMAAIKGFDMSAMVIETPHVEVDRQTRHGVKYAMDETFRQNLCEKLYKFHGKQKTVWLYDGWMDTWGNPEFDGCEIIDDLHNIKLPVLAIQGDMDEYGLPSQLERLKKHTNGPVETVLLKDCRHFPHIEKKADVLNLTADFLNRHLNKH